MGESSGELTADHQHGLALDPRPTGAPSSASARVQPRRSRPPRPRSGEVRALHGMLPRKAPKAPPAPPTPGLLVAHHSEPVAERVRCPPFATGFRTGFRELWARTARCASVSRKRAFLRQLVRRCRRRAIRADGTTLSVSRARRRRAAARTDGVDQAFATRPSTARNFTRCSAACRHAGAFHESCGGQSGHSPRETRLSQVGLHHRAVEFTC